MVRQTRLRRYLPLLLVALLASACVGGSPTGGTPAGSSPAASPTSTPAAPTATIPAAPTTAPTATTTPPTGGSPPAASATAAPAGPTVWSELPVSGAAPGPREDHTWTLDVATGSAYLFGGRNRGDASNELWRYDLAADAWTLIEPAGSAPDARFGHVSVWVEGVGLVVWSGQAGTTFFSDIWAFDPAAGSWQELPATGDVPPARYGSCGGIGPDGRLWISHGFTEDEGRFSDTRAYDFSSGTWADLTVDGQRPVERCLHDCLWTADGRLVVYAGQTTGVPAIGDLWALDPSAGSWTQAEEPAPEARQLYALATVGDVAFVFGGGSQDGRMLDDLWQLDLAGLEWSQPPLAGVAPVARAGATLLADPARSRLLLFGGTTGRAELDDLWQLDLGGG